MSSSNTIVVTTVVQDRAVAVDGFGTIMILGAGVPHVGVQSYAVSADGLVAMIADGYSLTSDPYRKVAAMAAQDVHPTTVKVFPRATSNAQEYTYTPINTTEGFVHSFELDCDGTVTDIEYTNGAAETPTTIATALDALVNAVAGVSSTDNTGSFTFSPDDDDERIYLRGLTGSTNATVEDGSADAGIAADLAAAIAADNDFYGVLASTTAATEIAALGAACATAKRIFGALSLDSDNFTTDDGVAYTLEGTTNNYTYVLPTRDSIGQGEAGLMARQFALAPGASSWAHKAINGQTADALAQGELDGARDNNALTYFYESGISHTLDGKACGGRFLDIVRGIDWLDSVIHSNMLTVMIAQEKIPYTDSGAALFETALRGALGAAETAGLLAPGWSIARGAVADQSAADKAARVFPALSWNAVLAGGIHTVNPVSGTVTL